MALNRLIGIFLLVSAFCSAQDKEEYEVDPVLESWVPPKYLIETFPYVLSGEDDDGRPIWILEFGKWDLRALVDSGPEKVKEFDMYADQFFYRVQRSIKERDTENNPVKGWVCIFDMEGYNLRQVSSVPTLTYMLTLAQKFEKAARNMDYGFLINLNFVGQRFIQLMTPVLGTTLSRAEISGTNKAVWLPKVLKNIPRKSLPEWYGGSEDYAPLKVYG